jgi:hypothetical protein
MFWILLVLSPMIAATAIIYLLFPISPLLALIVSTAVWYALSMKIWGIGRGGGSDGSDEIGGPFNID